MTETSNQIYDTIIIGGGPAGLTAGLYASRARLKSLLLEGSGTVSQITVSDSVENYPGIPEINGFELNDRFRSHALAFGLEIRTEQVREVVPDVSGGTKIWKVLAGQDEYSALSLIVATGAKWRSLGVPGEERFAGRGVSSCATCDAPFYRGREVVVVGGGDTAVQEAVFLTKFTRKVTLVHRRNRLRATAILQERAHSNPGIVFELDSVLEEISGENAVSAVTVKNLKTLQTKKLAVDGVFIFIGLDPNTEFIRRVVSCTEHGYIMADKDMKTSAEGIFACGDCIEKAFRQVITACGDGATAAHSVELYLEYLKGRSY